MVRPLAVLGIALLLLLTSAAEASHGRGRHAQPSPTTLSMAPAPGNGTLVVVVNATGGDGSFGFDATGAGLPASFAVATTNGTGNVTFTNLSADAPRALAPRAAAGWALAHAACSDGQPSNVTVRDNATTTCWFEQVRLARLLVVQNASGGDAAFPFQGTGAGLPGNFTLATANGTASLAFELRPGAYALAAPALAGWNRSAGTCSDGAPAALDLAANESVTCWFDAARLNTLVVRKTTEGGDATFEFVTSGGSLPARFTLTTVNGTATRVFEDVDASVAHSVHEVALAGWSARAAACDRGTPSNVTLGPGQSATCTFPSVKLGTVVLVVRATGGDAGFRVTSDGTGGLPAEEHVWTGGGEITRTYPHVEPGAHHLAVHPPAGWRLVHGGCTTGLPSDFTLAPNATVTCTFAVTALAEARGLLWNDADRDGARDAGEPGFAGWRVYSDLDGDHAFDAGEPNATTDAAGAYALPGLAATAHALRVVVPAGWTPTAPADGVRFPMLPAGTVVTGLDYGLATTLPPPASPERHGGGPGYWKNWDKHGHHDAATLDAWMRAIAASSAWLMPAGYAEDGAGLRQLLEDATKQCNRRHGQDDCARLKLDARHLVLRLNLLAGHASPDAAVTLGSHHGAREWLGLPERTTVRGVLDALEAKAGATPTRAQLKGLAGLLAEADGEA